MKEEYKDGVDQIHAPKDLIERTKRAVKQEEKNYKNENSYLNESINSNIYINANTTKDIDINSSLNTNANKKPYDFRWKQIVIAASACLVLFAGGLGYYQSNNQISINTVNFAEDNSFGTGLLLGKEDENKSAEDDSDTIDNSNKADDSDIIDNSNKVDDSDKADNSYEADGSERTDNSEKGNDSNGEIDLDKVDNIQIIKLEEKDEIVKSLLTMTASKISGEKVFIGVKKETETFYACIDKKQVYYLIIGNQIGKDEFIKYLKENIKNL